MRESMFLSIYRVYIIKVNKGAERKWQESKERRRERVFSLLYIDIVYNSIIEIRERIGRGKDMFIIYRTLIQT